MTDNLKTWPERIWIEQDYGNENLPIFDGSKSEIVWLKERNDCPEYVRADLLEGAVNINKDNTGLLPCPFCGGYAIVDNGPPELWRVECGDCGVSGNIKYTKSSAIEAWNKRYS